MHRHPSFQMDVLIQNCSIIDGSGAPAFTGSVGITDGKLTYKGVAGTVPTSKCTINMSCQRRVTFKVVPK